MAILIQEGLLYFVVFQEAKNRVAKYFNTQGVKKWSLGEVGREIQ